MLFEHQRDLVIRIYVSRTNEGCYESRVTSIATVILWKRVYYFLSFYILGSKYSNLIHVCTLDKGVFVNWMKCHQNYIMPFWQVTNFVFRKPCILVYYVYYHHPLSHARLQNDKLIAYEVGYKRCGSGYIVFLLERVIITQTAFSYTNSHGKSNYFCSNEYWKGKLGV